MIAIIDYGMGNVGSILNMIKKVGGNAVITSDHHEIEMAEKLILPGVGSFDHGMINLTNRGVIPLVEKKVLQDKTPILGICLGMQLMTRSSEEGTSPGLSWVDAKTVKFRMSASPGSLKIPHMGWNTIVLKKKCSLTDALPPEPRYYFVHSYHVECMDASDILATTFYGYEFVSAFQHDNIIGVQFHPEKSHKFGMAIMRNFIAFRQ